MRVKLPIVLKGYPRLSETFVAQEILELERLGFEIEIWSLRQPTDGATHLMHKQIKAPARYLPEYLYQGVGRVLRGFGFALKQPGFWSMLRQFLLDFQRDPTPNRGRRLGQALVLAREMDGNVTHLHVHFLHTPCSVVRYAALLTGKSFSFSAHAKDIWTTPDWEKREKIADCRFGVTCTREGLRELQRVSADKERVALVYHGLDLKRFPAPPERPLRKGISADDPVRIISIGRAVAKKGFDDLIAALALLPEDIHWQMTHIGGGELLNELKNMAHSLGVGERIIFAGSKSQSDVIEALRQADMFVLACKEGEGGDRDGLPNVIMEAATQGLAIISTDFAGVPEFITDDENGCLVPPSSPKKLSESIACLCLNPELRQRLGAAARRRVETDFSFEAGVRDIAGRLRAAMGQA